jgi:VWFA-related protein
MTRPLAALLVSALLVSTADARAQETPPTFEEKVEVQEVLLDALVTDRQGSVILGLEADDFVVEENGEPVELTAVSFYSNRRFTGDSAVVARSGIDLGSGATPDPRYFIVFLHDQTDANNDAPGLLARQLDAGRRIQEWIRTELLVKDWVAVTGWDRKLKVWSDFTRDHDSAAAAVASAMRRTDPGTNWPSRIRGDGENPSLLVSMPKGNELRDRTETIYDGLTVLAEAAGEVRGRKNLVMLTTGFGSIGGFGMYVPDARYYDPMQQALNGNNVAVYAIDLIPPGTEHTMSNAMNHLAADTGGRYLFNFTSFATPLRQIAEENGGYYLLSYRSEHPAEESGFQKVKVRTKNPEFRVKAREGYQY